MDFTQIDFKDDTRYAYAVGRIRALETKLLTRADFSRLLDADDYAQAIRLLGEMGYPITEESAEYEPVLMAEQRSALDLLGQLSEDDRLTKMFRRRYDFHNLKVLLKAKHSAQQLDQAILDLGFIPREALTEAVAVEGTGQLPEALGRAKVLAEKAFGESRFPADLDVTVDREQYAFMTKALGELDNLFLETWLTWQIDLLNIKTFLRLHWLQEDRRAMDRDMLPGGGLDTAFFREIREESLDALGQIFMRTPYGRAVSEGVSQLKAQKSFAALERRFDDLLIQLLKQSREASFGAEPVAAYLLFKEYEIQAVRAVMVGKLNQLPKEKIKERLPSEYI